ncbi:uncharacterized protein VDAG_10337 [Verticillium dahliae VdLs.17]|uniref:Transcription factor RfeG n=1 Tax=Verticillium dahliae (strain VdLs.17 / ATCC MYA-4575 / FGSC 10137) TaxID=498257 RepID=G2XJK5_VERDV|nr:uncharacterized protein VDAG_10337 [Verticillium dahliae VdLs.17]EGY20708.1 hypothetical protein VDAG_10337 [Verticillium dahliae VdLs.17]
MASRQPRGGAPQSSGVGASTASSRSNEYFVPRDGIDREVITADICRYLGNDALVRPGHYENPQTGQAVQGYYITAYRNLTTAMIDDLKARLSSGQPSRHSNSPILGYRDSATHNARQHFGPTTETAGGYSDGRDPYDAPRYPGSQAPGYSGNSGSYPSQGGASAHASVQSSYGSTGGYQYPPQNSTYSPQPDPRYPASQTASYGPPDMPYTNVSVNSVNSAMRQQYNDPYGSSQAGQRIPAAAAPGPGQAYGQQAAAAYGGAPGYYPQQQAAASYGSSQAQAPDTIYGRGASSPNPLTSTRKPSDFVASPAGASQAFSSAQGQQYAPNPTPRAAASSSSSTQMASSAAPHSRREREPTDRHRASRR